MRFLSSLALVCVISLFATTSAQETITLWYENATPEHQEALKQDLVEPFNASQSDYQLVIEFRGNDLDRQLRTAMLARGGPDLVMTAGPTYALAMAEANQLLPLDDYAAKFGWNDKFAGVMLDLGTIDGSLYALPITYESLVLFYDQTLFEKLNLEPPVTPETFEKAAQTLLDQGIVPLSAGNSDWRGANEWYVTAVLNHIAGPQAVYEALSGNKPWTDPEFVKAISTLKTWWDDGWFGSNYFSLTLEQAFAETASENAGMSINGTWAYQWLKAYYEDADVKANWTPIPSFAADAPSPLYSIGVGTTLSINKNSPNPDGAAAVLDYLTTPDFIQAINRDWPGQWNLPVSTVSEANLSQVTNPLYAAHIEALSKNVDAGNYGYTTWSFWPPRTDQYLIEGIERVWLGDLSVEDYLSEMNRIFQEEFQAGGVPPLPPRN